MAKRLVSLREFDELEGMVDRHRGLLERLEQLERAAAVRHELADAPERLLIRAKG